MNNYTFMEDSYEKATLIYQQNNEILFNLCSDKEVCQICSAIVFPEFIRYSEFKDFFETEALKAVYVIKGSEIVDFSIGYCQMKPSFIEKIENYVSGSNNIKDKYSHVLKYRNNDIKEKRNERVERLESIEWQFKYLLCFYDIMEELTSGFIWESIDEKIKYYSTAYNYNFLASKESIIQMYDKKYFPYGPKYKGNQYAYYEIAIQFYKSNFKE